MQLRLAKERSEAELTAEVASHRLQLSESKRECDLLKRALSQMKARSKKMEQIQVRYPFLVCPFCVSIPTREGSCIPVCKQICFRFSGPDLVVLVGMCSTRALFLGIMSLEYE